MANYNYVPSEQVKLQQRMAEELMNTPMRQGLRGGQPTDWGRGLAHMLRQWQGGKQLREAKEQAEFNTETLGKDSELYKSALAQGANPTSPMAGLGQAQFETPEYRDKASDALARREERKQDQLDALALAEKRYGKGGYGQGRGQVLQIFDQLRNKDMTDTDRDTLFALQRALQYKNTGTDFDLANKPDWAGLTIGGQPPTNQPPAGQLPAVDGGLQQVSDPLNPPPSAPAQGSPIPPMPAAGPLQQTPNQAPQRVMYPAPQPYQPQQETTEPAIPQPVTPQQATANALRTPTATPDGKGAFRDKIPINLAPDKQISYVSEAEKAKEMAKNWAANEQYEVVKAREKPKVTIALKRNKQRHQTIRNNAKEALALVDGWSAGLFSATDLIPGTKAAQLKAALVPVGGQIAMTELKALRETSTSGASGLGQLNKFEFEALQNAWESLETSQTPAQLREALNNVIHLSTTQEATGDELYNMIYGHAMPWDEEKDNLYPEVGKAAHTNWVIKNGKLRVKK